MYYNLFVHLPTEGLLGSVVSEGEGDGIITKMLLWMFFVHLWGTNVLEYTHTYSWREKSRWVDVVVVESLSCIQLLWPHGLEHTRLLCPLLSLRVCWNSCPLSWWCYLTISSSATHFFCLQSFPASGALSWQWRGNKLAVCLRWPNYWSFSNSPYSDYLGLISFRIDWFDLLAFQGTHKSLLQHHNLKASILRCSALWSNSHMTTRKTIAK